MFGYLGGHVGGTLTYLQNASGTPGPAGDSRRRRYLCGLIARHRRSARASELLLYNNFNEATLSFAMAVLRSDEGSQADLQMCIAAAGQ
jgi:hypothetical protein